MESSSSRKVVYSHCHYCVSLCGTKITVDGNKIVSIEPDRENPMSWRDFCRKGKSADEMVSHPARILKPMKRVGDRYEESTYEEAYLDIATKLNKIIVEHGVDAVGSYSGNPLGFDFAGSIFFNGLLDAIGTGNRFWVGSIDQNNAHVVQDTMFGSELLSLPADIDECNFFLLLGMDPVQSKFGWLEVIPDGWNRVLKRQQQGAQVVVVDPRFSDTAKCADTYLSILPGQDWAFVLGMLHIIFTENLDQPSATPLSNIDPIREIALNASLTDLSSRCGIAEELIQDVARRFAKADRAMAVAHTGISHHANGTIGEWLVTVLNAVTNRLDTPGGRRLERGYMDIVKIFSSFAPPSTHRTRLKNLPAIAGYHALAELADEITTPGENQIKAMMIVSGNPVISGPDGDSLDEALKGLDLLVAVDIIQRDSHRHADWLIPGTHFLEREGLHCLVSGMMDKPFVQYANKAVNPPPGVQYEWEFFMNLAIAMKRPYLGKKGVNSFIKFTKLLARITGKSHLAFNPRWIEWLLVTTGRRIKYKDILKHPHGWIYSKKRYGDLRTTLRTKDNAVQVSPPEFISALKNLLIENEKEDTEFPMIMVNKRGRESMNSWMNDLPGMNNTERNSPLDIHPDDAQALNLHQGQIVTISSKVSSMEAPINIVDGGRRGVISMAHGWGSSIYDPVKGTISQGYGTNRNRLVDRHQLDQFSQVPSLSGVPVKIEAAAHSAMEQG
ncbi:molybdopterin-containing oxidoreductase family protein [Zhongshania aquimaris]|uniref:Molybdopterin-dependent oxidoreductase n=1 Tax=Zhongshania aquimaris TaxID=2857107 RepID=A0ABS6VV28_9GAMM|nr:molybdopterin-dependent oxidoreductase [Zhongshania aquimaris]MBW2942177.1 molybdopterin-dependent oxidoreductase [Zhongshania aquimaris]